MIQNLKSKVNNFNKSDILTVKNKHVIFGAEMQNITTILCNFHWLDSLGQVSHRVAMSVTFYIYVSPQKIFLGLS